MNQLLETIRSKNFEEDKLYLIENINDNFGFFYSNREIIFGKKSDKTSIGSSISTDYLDMELNVYIESLNMNNTYNSGNYDLLIFKNIDDEIKMDIFYNICSSYANDQSGISFSDFFNSLVDIFREHGDMDYANVLGLLGEMIFIKKTYEICGKNISQNWHRTGINSKFDFTFSGLNIEVKTTSKSELEFSLKHSQIFNNQNNYVAIVNVLETGEGESIETLYDYFQKTKPFSTDVKLQICLNKELARVRKPGKNKFSLDNISIVNVNDMKKIEDIPSCINNISYDYDFSDDQKMDISKIADILN